MSSRGIRRCAMHFIESAYVQPHKPSIRAYAAKTSGSKLNDEVGFRRGGSPGGGNTNKRRHSGVDSAGRPTRTRPARDAEHEHLAVPITGAGNQQRDPARALLRTAYLADS